jgi:hypothetical protein
MSQAHLASALATQFVLMFLAIGAPYSDSYSSNLSSASDSDKKCDDFQHSEPSVIDPRHSATICDDFSNFVQLVETLEQPTEPKTATLLDYKQEDIFKACKHNKASFMIMLYDVDEGSAIFDQSLIPCF